VLDELKSRALLYALTSRVLLQELDVDFIKNLKNDKNLLAYFPNTMEWDLFNEMNVNELLNEHLNVDFTNISILHLTPYETFYTRDDGMVESGGANPVTDLFHSYNFKVDFERARVVAPDHIGVELEFMYSLVNQTIEALQGDDQDKVKELLIMQKEFMRNHLLKWAPMYLISAKFEARTPFYSDAADLTLEFILSDFEYINEVLNA
jgi:TorA maturation chaperone TorD